LVRITISTKSQCRNKTTVVEYIKEKDEYPPFDLYCYGTEKKSESDDKNINICF